MFWAITTTVALGLAAIALLSGRSALLASRLLTAMMVGFGLLVWLPVPFADPHKLFGWAGQRSESGDNGSGMDCHRFSQPKSLRFHGHFVRRPSRYRMVERNASELIFSLNAGFLSTNPRAQENHVQPRYNSTCP